MRIFRVKEIVVVDYFSGEKKQLPSECVVFEFSEHEWAQLSTEDATWIVDSACVTEYVDSTKLLRTYMSFLARKQRWLAFSGVTSTHLPLPVALGLFSMIRRQPFELNGKAAFDLLSFLFIDLSGALRRGGKWQFQPGSNYQVRGIPEKWCIGVTVPDGLDRLLIGPSGSTIARVEEYTDYIKNRISLRD